MLPDWYDRHWVVTLPVVQVVIVTVPDLRVVHDAPAKTEIVSAAIIAIDINAVFIDVLSS